MRRQRGGRGRFYIDAHSPIDHTDDRWRLLTIFEEAREGAPRRFTAAAHTQKRVGELYEAFAVRQEVAEANHRGETLTPCHPCMARLVLKRNHSLRAWSLRWSKTRLYAPRGSDHIPCNLTHWK